MKLVNLKIVKYNKKWNYYYYIKYIIIIMFRKSIILSSIIFGSVYLNGISLMELNKISNKPKNEVNYTMFIINNIVFTSSSIIIILCGRKALQMLLN